MTTASKYKAPHKVRRQPIKSIMVTPPYTELVARCPHCRVMEMVQITEDNKLVRTSKFSQRASAIFHDCGSVTPCSLFLVNPDSDCLTF